MTLNKSFDSAYYYALVSSLWLQQRHVYKVLLWRSYVMYCCIQGEEKSTFLKWEA